MTTTVKPPVTQQQIQEYSNRIAAEFEPERIILFGSYAYGAPTADSDVDLLIVMDHRDDSSRQALEIRRTVRADFPVDLLVRSPEQIKQRLELNDWFMREVIERGRTIYAAADAGVDRQS